LQPKEVTVEEENGEEVTPNTYVEKVTIKPIGQQALTPEELEQKLKVKLCVKKSEYNYIDVSRPRTSCSIHLPVKRQQLSTFLPHNNLHVSFL